MTREEKDLLLKDLCARLPYGVKGVNEYAIVSSPKEWRTECTLEFAFLYRIEKYKWRPYLFPLSGITDEQIMQSPISVHVCDLENLRYANVWTELNSRFTDLIDLFDWLNKNHFDYRGLIEKGLAIDATGLNIY